MLAQRRFSPALVVRFALRITIRASVWAALVFSLYAFADLYFLRIPFLPLSTIGVAVAFYVGFKNNSSYDRFWEGRKIWGGVVNASRSWATAVLCYILPGDDSAEAKALRQELIYRHLAWTNALRLQLRRTSRFFDKPSRGTRIRMENHAEHMRNDWDTELAPFLSAPELAEMSARLNPATHMLTRQGTRLSALQSRGELELFHQIAMMDLITELYALQGKCERIKHTPFPRQYAEYSRVFTQVFVLLIPFGLLDVFANNVEQASASGLQQLPWILPLIAASALISWVFETMETIGDASEDPFERSMNDVPMNALCRTIERDLRQLLGEPDDALPPAEQPIDGLLY
ncbi:MAG: putative membrane protein [Myxococcota bacterium]|jgi:putative membrane protein